MLGSIVTARKFFELQVLVLLDVFDLLLELEDFEELLTSRYLLNEKKKLINEVYTCFVNIWLTYSNAF